MVSKSVVRARILIAVVLASASCVGADRDTTCRWPADHGARVLNLSESADRRHLADDSQVAEDLAIRHADATRPPDWQSHRDDYRRLREECRARLNLVVARQHGVTVEAVIEGAADRREWLDAIVVIAFAGLFAAVAMVVTSSMMRGALVESRMLAGAMLLGASLVAGTAGVMASSVFVGLVESVRVGNGHMSYRVERLPLRHRRLETFMAGAIGFAVIGAIQFRRKRPD